MRQAVANLGSAAELARALGVTKESVSIWQAGECVPAQKYIDAICTETGLTPESAWLQSDVPHLAPAEAAARVLASNKISLRRLAAETGLPIGSLSEARNGKRNLKPAQIATLAIAAIKLMPSLSHPSSGHWARQERARRACRRCTQMNLSDDVLQFFGLDDDPWRLDVRKDSDVFPTRDYLRIQKGIGRAIARKDFAVIAGPTGAGKSQMARRAFRELAGRKSVKLVHLVAPDIKLINSSSVCDAIVNELAPKTVSQIRTMKLAIQVAEILREHARLGNTPLLVIDDAHRCTLNTLAQLKRFWEFRAPESYDPLLGIVLLGWPQLPLALHNNPELLEVARRADIIELRGLKGEHDEYIHKKLARVGAKKAIFTAAAIKALAAVPAAQWPLPTNRIASRSMRLAFDQAKTLPKDQRGQVLPDHVRQAAQEVT